MNDGNRIADSTALEQRGRPWCRGESGNPKGRPKGSRNAALAALDAIGAQEAEAILRTVVAKAQQGDLRAAEVLLSRAWPAAKGRPITLKLPILRTAEDAAAAIADLVAAVASGALTPSEAAEVSTLIESYRRAVETTLLEARIVALEGKVAV